MTKNPDEWNELHDMCMRILSHEYQEFWELKEKMAEYKDKTWIILDHLTQMGFVEVLRCVEYRDEEKKYICGATHSFRVKVKI